MTSFQKQRRQTAQEIIERFQIPETKLGPKPRGRKPKITQAKIDKFLFGFVEKVTGEKLTPFQERLLKAVMEAESRRRSSPRAGLSLLVVARHAR